ncbi:MAG: endonuclease/exonuclease/phosphatase family protein [Hyphomonas sp.]
MGTDRKRDPDRILRILAALSADVVALQEADRRLSPRRPALERSEIRSRTGLVPVEFDHDRDSLGWHGNAILVRPEFEIVERAHFDLPGLEPRGAVTALLKSGATRFRVVGVHLGLLRGSRRAQLDHLSDLLEDYDEAGTIILGDFNERSLSKGLGRLSPKFRIMHAGPTYHSRRPTFALDRVALSDGVRANAVGVLNSNETRRGSDHLPIYADLSLAET